MMSRPILISIGFHLAFALLAIFGLPMLGRDLPEDMPIVPGRGSCAPSPRPM